MNHSQGQIRMLDLAAIERGSTESSAFFKWRQAWRGSPSFVAASRRRLSV